MNQNSPLSFSNIFKRETKLAAYFIICLTLVVLSVSYALFFSVDDNTNDQVVTAGDLKFTYKNGQAISSSSSDTAKNICFQPMSDEEAELYWNECSYRFSVTNTGTLSATYSLSLSQMEDNAVAPEYLKVILRKEVDGTKETVNNFPIEMNNLTIKNGEYVLVDNATLGTNSEEKTIVYQVQIYINEATYNEDVLLVDPDADPPVGKQVNYQINGSGIVHEEDLDPEIPVDPNPFANPKETIDEAGNGLYAVPHTDATSMEEGWQQTEWRYGGVNYVDDDTPYVHNYVTFNNEVAGWRIIGLANVLVIQPDDSKKVEQRLKIIKDQSIGEKAWDSGNVNDWTQASLMKDFNEAEGEYYKTLTEDAMKMIDKNIIWNLGGISGDSSSEDYYQKLKANEWYKKERGTEVYQDRPTEWPKPEGETYTPGKALVGLMYPSDYGYAVGGGKEMRDNCLTSTKLYNYNGDCAANDWLFLKSREWLLSPTSSYSDFAFYVSSSGFVINYRVDSSYAVRPVVYLSSKVSITDGKGTKSEPYILTAE